MTISNKSHVLRVTHLKTGDPELWLFKNQMGWEPRQQFLTENMSPQCHVRSSGKDSSHFLAAQKNEGGLNQQWTKSDLVLQWGRPMGGVANFKLFPHSL